MEELILTDPVVVPEVVTNKYRVVALLIDHEVSVGPPDNPPGSVTIRLRDNNNVQLMHQYQGQEARDMIKWLNTANFSVNSMHKRVLQKLSNDGIIVGTVTGTPDPAEDTNGE